MKNTDINRVRFFSSNDMSRGHNMKKAEPLLKHFDPDKSFDINETIELYQIKLFVDNEIYLKSWSKEKIENYIQTTKRMWAIVCNYFIKISDETIIDIFDNLELGNQYSFWSLIDKLKGYKQISKSKFSEILNNPELWIRDILRHKNLTNHFGNEVKEYLINCHKSAELLLTQFEEEHLGEHKELFFPKLLNLEDKEIIISKYLDNPDANLNYVRLVLKARDTQHLRLSPHTKLKAKRLEKKLNEDILKNGSTWVVGNQVSFSADQDKPILIDWEDNIQKISYSTKFLDSQKENIQLFRNFSLLFQYIDLNGFITLVSKNAELSTLEKIFMHSRNEYRIGPAFSRKTNLSHLQLFIYQDYLNKKNNSVEKILKYFFENFIGEYFGVENFKIAFPSNNASELEKANMIVPQLEFILKQYKLFVEDRIIDHELLQLSSNPSSYKDIPSLVEKKYFYGKGQEVDKLKYFFFSDQSPLNYIKTIEDNYFNFFGLLLNEDVNIECFENYQKDYINNLIDEEYLFLDERNNVKIKNEITIFIIGKIFNDEVISYWHFPESIRQEIDHLEKKGLLFFESSLLSKPEQQFFNFYLNKAEFTNGLDLRNKYAHGTNSHSVDENRNDYLILLKLIVLIALKIEDDLLMDYNLVGADL